METPIEVQRGNAAPAALMAASAFDALPEHIAVLDEAGTILLVNRAWRRFAAEHGAPADLSRQSYFAACGGARSPDQPTENTGAEAEAGIRRVLAGNLDRFHLEYSCTSADGPSRWYRMQVSPFQAPQPREARLLVVHEDITQRREAEQRLRESEHRLRLALEASATGMWDWDIESGRVTWSPECRAIHGVSEGELGQAAEDFNGHIHPDDRPRVREAVQRALDTGTSYECDLRIIRPDGQLRWIASFGRAICDAQGRPLRMIGTITDITARQQREQQLRESEHRLLLALEASATGMWDWDVRTDRVSWSPECYTIHGVREGEFDGSAEAFDKTVHPDDRERVWDAVTAATNEHTRYACEFRIIRPDGEIRWVSNVGRALYDEQNRPTRMIGTITDITPRKQAEAALGRKNQELQRFTSVASHDLKEPLRGVATLARFMLHDEPHLSPEGNTRLQRIGILCDRLTEMINALLEYARSGGEPQMISCDLNLVVRNAADKLDEELRGRNVRLTIDPDLPTIRGDPSLLERVFANLIVNGIKYNTSEIKEIHIGRDKGTVFVRDNGVGIPPRHHGRIFELFHQIPGTAPREGVGLGLALVKSIVESHGGQISVTSAVGQGSTFSLRFPASSPSPRNETGALIDSSES